MELQLIMDNGSESLGGAMWLTSSLSPTYQQLSPDGANDCEPLVEQQASSGEQVVQSLIWQDKQQLSLKASPEQNHHHQHHQNHLHHQQQRQRNHQQYPDSPLSASSQSPEHKLSVGSSSIHSPSPTQTLKRPADETYQHQQLNEPERKIACKNGSNGSQGWPSQVEELTEHLVTDFDGSLSALAASDLATAVASYNMSEALLAFPSLTVFKQEALSPENQRNNSNTLNHHVSQRDINGTVSNHGSTGLAEADSNNNPQNSANLHTDEDSNNNHCHNQLLYSNSANDEYTPNSISGNHVSSSQQGSEINEDCRFQYVLAAATSIATKVNEETLTYLNQGQSYEIKFKKLGNLSAFRGKVLESTIRICFHERRLQYTEREQILAWQRARPGERLLEVDVPLSYGMINVCQSSSLNNSVDFTWDPTKEVGCYVKVNCISTEFTPKKHGGEKGVPFRIQVDTRVSGGPRLHAASCQVKVFKLKGADRKHKQDRDKIRRRPPHEQDKYQPSYDCTILSDIPLDSLSDSVCQNAGSPYSSTDVISPQSRASGSSSPVAAPLAPSSSLSTGTVVNAVESIKDDVIGTSAALPSPSTAILPDQNPSDTEQQHQNHQQWLQMVESCQQQQQPASELPADASAAQTIAWLRAHRFHPFESTFASFSAADILRLSRDDLIQICGLADGIRLFNILHAKAPRPKLSLYFALEDSSLDGLWHPVHLDTLTVGALVSKLFGIFCLPRERLRSILMLGPQGIHVLVNNDHVANIKDESMFLLETINESGTDNYKLLLKPYSH